MKNQHVSIRSLVEVKVHASPLPPMLKAVRKGLNTPSLTFDPRVLMPTDKTIHLMKQLLMSDFSAWQYSMKEQSVCEVIEVAGLTVVSSIWASTSTRISPGR